MWADVSQACVCSVSSTALDKHLEGTSLDSTVGLGKMDPRRPA